MAQDREFNYTLTTTKVAAAKPREKPYPLTDGGGLFLEVLKLTGFAQSGSQARRLVEGGGIKVNGQTAVDAYIALSGEAVISRGKNRFVKVRFKG